MWRLLKMAYEILKHCVRFKPSSSKNESMHHGCVMLYFFWCVEHRLGDTPHHRIVASHHRIIIT